MTAELLQCPTPFIIGLPREYCKSDTLPEDACVVDIDNDIVQVPPTLHKTLSAARRLARAMDTLCRPELHNCDVPMGSNRDQLKGSHAEALEIAKLCKQFIADLLYGVRECCFVCSDRSEDVVFLDESLFQDYRKSRAKASMFAYDKSFLEQFLRTQLFSQHLGLSIPSV